MTRLDDVQSAALKPFLSFVRRLGRWWRRRRAMTKWDVREMRRHW